MQLCSYLRFKGKSVADLWCSDELARALADAPAEKREEESASSGSDDAGIPDEAANPAGIRTDGASSCTP